MADFWCEERSAVNVKRNRDGRIIPNRLMISLTSECNLRCWHCERALERNVTQRTELTRKFLDYVMREIMPHIRFLRIGGTEPSEQLLAQEFSYFMRHIDKQKLKEIQLITNLTVLDAERARLIVDKVDKIQVSLEGVEAQYEEIRGSSWERLLNNLSMLQSCRSAMKRSKLKIQLVVCATLSQLENLSKVFELNKVGVDSIVFREFSAYERNKEKEPLSNDRERTRYYIKRYMELSKKNDMPIEIMFKSKYLHGELYSGKEKSILCVAKCMLPWNCMAITSNGTIGCCCYLYSLTKIDLTKPNLLEAFNGGLFAKLREEVNSNKPSRQCICCEIKTAHVLDRDKNELVAKINGKMEGYRLLNLEKNRFRKAGVWQCIYFKALMSLQSLRTVIKHDIF